ncbi:hypothetical protein BV25DRAFT_1916906 [Artomyces pyxidatus]|uniref:Uncharacterized protein n=1 Tax=Artomyces pyxidatus TaxID=48021 RepID=A0ACB8SYT0_9AGAM|nr:hypothetical protein BV25DRAFT_1916906 [Artomyces pyxidatus]
MSSPLTPTLPPLSQTTMPSPAHPAAAHAHSLATDPAVLPPPAHAGHAPQCPTRHQPAPAAASRSGPAPRDLRHCGDRPANQHSLSPPLSLPVATHHLPSPAICPNARAAWAAIRTPVERAPPFTHTRTPPCPPFCSRAAQTAPTPSQDKRFCRRAWLLYAYPTICAPSPLTHTTALDSPLYRIVDSAVCTTNPEQGRSGATAQLVCGCPTAPTPSRPARHGPRTVRGPVGHWRIAAARPNTYTTQTTHPRLSPHTRPPAHSRPCTRPARLPPNRPSFRCGSPCPYARAALGRAAIDDHVTAPFAQCGTPERVRPRAARPADRPKSPPPKNYHATASPTTFRWPKAASH